MTERQGSESAARHQARILYRSLHWLAVLSVVLLVALAFAPAKAHFNEWRTIQQRYNERAAAEGISPTSVKVRQIWRPEIELTDRCVSCHLSMGGDKPLPSGGPLFSEHPEVHHDVSTMGCTICHRGQGRATTKDDAHGSVKHWEDPMLPRALLQASCAQCHAEGSRVPRLADLERGGYLFELHGCSSCHVVDGEGGKVGPNLSGVGLKGYSRDWQIRHLKSPGDTVEGSKMMSFGHLSDEDLELLLKYMEGLIGAPKLARGKALAMELGCRGCHRIGGVGGEEGPDLADAVGRPAVERDFTNVEWPHTNASWQRAHLREPQKVSPDSAMPPYQLPPEDEDALLTYVMALRSSTLPLEQLPKETVLAKLHAKRDYPPDGETLFRLMCGACHGNDGAGSVMPTLDYTVPAVTNSDFLAVASEGYLRRSLALGRPARHMPAWSTKEAGLSEAEVDTLLSFIDSKRPAPPDYAEVQKAPRDLGLGRTVYNGDCAGCHGVHAEGTVIAPSLVSPELLFAADEPFLYETIARGRADTAMPSHGHLSAEALASLIGWIRTHEPAATVAEAAGEGEVDAAGKADWRSQLASKLQRKLNVISLEEFQAGGSHAYGATLFAQLCVGCHGDRGHGGTAPAIGNPAFLKVASDGFIASAILLGRSRRAMRPFDEHGVTQLNGGEVGDIIAFLRHSSSRLRHERLTTRVHSNSRMGRELFAAMCSGCHGVDGKGRTAPALNNQGFLNAATDGFLQATIARGRRGTAMRGWALGGFGFAELSPQHINDIVAYIRGWHASATRPSGSLGGS